MPYSSMKMNMGGAVALLALFLSQAHASGPADRVPTDPAAITSISRSRSAPVAVAAVVATTRISGAGVSFAGDEIAYVGDASGRLNVWVMGADGAHARQLTRSNERQADPQFSRDDKEIVFLQDRGGDEMYDLYAVAVAGGEPRNLTRTDDVSEMQPLFAPDGSRLAFICKSKSSPIFDVAVMEWPAGATRRLTHDTDPRASWSLVSWAPDGRSVFAVRRVGLDDSDVYRVDVATGTAENLTAHTGKRRVSASDVSPDGGTLLMTSNEKGGYMNVALFDLDARRTRWVTDTQWEAEGGAFAQDGKTFTYTLNADGRTTVEFVDTATLAAAERGVPPGLNDAAAGTRSFFADGGFLLLHQDSTHPTNLFRVAPDGRLLQLTHDESPELAAATLPTSTLVTYRSFDGRLISAFLWLPYNLQRNHAAPAVLLPHGGPTGQTVDRFDRRAVLLVSRGFVVLAPNVRGSTGYGMEFQQANVKDLGGADLKDEIAGVEFLKKTGFVDPRKVGIWGGSYGGFMTLMAIGKTPRTWAAAVDEYGILDWYTMLRNEDPALQEYEKSLLGDPEKDRAVYEASSPLKYIRNARAPLLVLQGERDIRVPKEEAEQVVSLLKSRRRTVEVVYYPDEGHGFIKREHQLDELTRSVDWLERYLNGRSTVAVAAPQG